MFGVQNVMQSALNTRKKVLSDWKSNQYKKNQRVILTQKPNKR